MRLIALAAVVVALAAGGWAILRWSPGGEENRAVATRTRAPTRTPSAAAAATDPAAVGRPPTAQELAVLARTVAFRTRGRVQVAVAAPGGGAPVAVASDGDPARRIRMWSVSKVVTSIALLEAYGWGDRRGRRVPAATTRAMRSALVRSADCAQRLLTVDLQERSGGRQAARRAFLGVLARAGVTGATLTLRSSRAASACRPLLARSGLPDPNRAALLAGTAEWTVADAARLGRALADGTFPRAVAAQVTTLLREPKGRSDDPSANGLDMTADPAWGAGVALAGLRPAYKAGWGGSSGETPTFVTEQSIAVDTADGPAGVAVTFEPPRTPTRDDPGLTRAPEAFAQVLRDLRATWLG